MRIWKYKGESSSPSSSSAVKRRSEGLGRGVERFRYSLQTRPTSVSLLSPLLHEIPFLFNTQPLPHHITPSRVLTIFSVYMGKIVCRITNSATCYLVMNTSWTPNYVFTKACDYYLYRQDRCVIKTRWRDWRQASCTVSNSPAWWPNPACTSETRNHYLQHKNLSLISTCSINTY